MACRVINYNFLTFVACSILVVGTNLASAQSDRLKESAKEKNNLANNYSEQINRLERTVKKSPNSCEGHLLLGKAYCKLHNYSKAREHYRAAIRVGHGALNAQIANKALLELPREFLAVKSGPETSILASKLGLMRERGIHNDNMAKVTVLHFSASWCVPCKQLQTFIDKAKAQYKDSVAFMTIDVDDPSNQQLVDQYEVSPVPTLIFLNPQGEVITYSIGFSGENSVTDGIKKVMMLEDSSSQKKVGENYS